MIEIVSATRLSEREFWHSSALGQSLKRLHYDDRIQHYIRFENPVGLPYIYNGRIQHSSADVLVFVHDDVWIDELLFTQALLAGLKVYDVIGVAGNRRRVARQPSWYYLDTLDWQKDDSYYLSGTVSYRVDAKMFTADYGLSPASCELLDGVFLASVRQTLIQHHVLFDPRFDFHFYDLDFCRSARQAGLELGSWRIALTHQSDGLFGSPSWFKNYGVYLDKWEVTVT